MDYGDVTLAEGFLSKALGLVKYASESVCLWENRMQVCTVCSMMYDVWASVHYTIMQYVYYSIMHSNYTTARLNHSSFSPCIQDAYRRLQYRKAKQIDRIQMVRDLGPDLLTHFGLGGTGGGGVGGEVRDGGLSIL